MDEKPEKPFFVRHAWIGAVIGVLVVRFVLPSEDSKELNNFIKESESSYEAKDFQSARTLATSALEIDPENEAALELKNNATKEEEKARLAKEQTSKEEAKVAEEQAIKDEEDRLKRETAKQEVENTVSEVVQELIEMGEGSIVNIRPTSGDNWIAIYVELDNSVHLFSSEEKRYVVEMMGPYIEAAIVETGVTNETDVNFIDQSGNTIATPKVFGGWEIKE